jgi:hypothetical protein
LGFIKTDCKIEKAKGGVPMTIANLKIGQRKFVVVPERDFDRMQSENQRYRQLLEEDRQMGELAQRELKAFKRSGAKGIPWEKIKKELGL